jgi:hypothetical protein
MIDKDKFGRRVTSMGDMRNAYKILVGKPDSMISLEKPRPVLENNINGGM